MTIGEIAQKTDLPESTLRYYEKKNLLVIKRDRNGRRVYSKSDIEWIKFISRLKETGMALKDIQRYSELRYLGQETMPERLEMLKKHRGYVYHKRKSGTSIWKIWTTKLSSIKNQ